MTAASTGKLMCGEAESIEVAQAKGSGLRGDHEVVGGWWGVVGDGGGWLGGGGWWWGVVEGGGGVVG